MDDFAAAAPRIAKLMLVALSHGATENERATAFNLLRQAVGEVDPGGHELAERIRSTPVNDEDIQRVFDAGCEKGRDEVLQRTPASKPSNGGAGSHTVGDHDRVNGDDTYNGYPLSDIAQHCTDNLNRIPATHHGFLEDMVSRLTDYETVSGRQARYLTNLFRQYFGGKM